MTAVVRLLVWAGSPSRLEGLHSVALRAVGGEEGERRMSPVGADMTLFRHLVVVPMCCLFGDGACFSKAFEAQTTRMSWHTRMLLVTWHKI